ncbi:MAG: ABC transporter permease [Tannerellaceae bacterium]|jgi:ABC-type multidrug transport system permease subunit|nr:ABC transporter permease [Tannerellaceae bacterium]
MAISARRRFLFLAGNLAFTAIGILVSGRTSKTEAGAGRISAVTMPMMILSGVFFSYHSFPQWGTGIIRSLPPDGPFDPRRDML